MATAIWPLENGQTKSKQKAPRSLSHIFACFRLFSTVFAHCRSFLHLLGCVFLTFFGRLIFPLFRTSDYFRGQKLNPNIFFSNFSGASGISRQNPGISRQKSLIPWVSRDIPNFLAPTPSRGRPPPHQKISGLKSLGLGSFFVPDICLLSF